MSKSRFAGVGVEKRCYVAHGAWCLTRFAVVAVMAMVFGLAGYVGSSDAAVSVLSASTVTNGNTVNFSAPSSGSDCVAVVHVTADATTSAVTLGGSATGVVKVGENTGNTANTTSLWQRSLGTCSSQNLNVAATTGANPTVHIVVYGGVDQTTPIFDSIAADAGAGNTTPPLTFTPTPTIDVPEGGLAAYANNANGANGTSDTFTPPTNGGSWTEFHDFGATSNRVGAAYRNVTTAFTGLTFNIADSENVTNGGTNRMSIVAYSLSPSATNPTVTINQASGQTDPTNGTPIDFDVIFSESVSDFIASDVTTGGTAPGQSVSVSGSGTTYTVSITPSGNGTVIPTIAAGAATGDTSSATNLASTSTDNTVTYDATAPTVTINQGSGQSDPTNATPISFDVVFSESVTGFAAGDVLLSGTATASVTNVTGSGTTYTVEVTPTSDGTVIATIPAGGSQDAAGNTNTASSSTDNTVSYDATQPTVAIGNLPASTSGDPITGVTVTFSESVSGFVAGDITLGGPGTPTVIGFSGSGANYSFNITGMSVGTITVDISAAVASDAAGNTSTAAIQVATNWTSCTPGEITIPNNQTVSGASVDLSTLHSNTGNISGFTYKINTVAEMSPWDSTSIGTGVPENVTLEVSGTDTDCSVTVTQSNTITVDNRPDDLTVGVASGSQSGLTTITVTMPYSGDKNGNATFQVDYKLASSGTWNDGTPQDDADNLTPYLEPITGLTADETYDIRVTYFDDEGVTGTNPQTFQVTLVSWVDDYLLHNSNRFACSETGFFSNEADCIAGGGTWTYDRKWTVAGNEGEWGTDGANDQYGPIMCSTCHERNGGNIKRITTQVVASTSTFPGQGETISAQVANPATSTSDYGDDSDGRGASGSNRICEVCHSQTEYHRYDLTGQPGGLLHYNNKDCISCHEHEGGFRASCSACHGNPPVDLASRVTTKPTGSATAGAHDMHVNTVGVDCSVCHNGSVGSGATHDSDGTITITFVDLPNPAGSFGKSTGGSYDGQTTANYDTTLGSTTVTKTGNKTCANYCHGYGDGDGTPGSIGGTAIAWDAVRTPGECNLCHRGDDTAAGMRNAAALGSHRTHAGGDDFNSSGANRLAVNGNENWVIACTDCHGPNAGALLSEAGVQSHVNGNVHWDVNNLTVDYRGGTKTYKGGTTGGTADLAMSAAYGSCDNLACHWGAPTPDWGSGAATCDTCHPASPTSGKHTEHIDASDDYVTCDNCHGSGATTGTHSGHIDFSLTLNPVNNADTLTSAKFSDGGTRGDTRDDTCVTICHKDGDWGDGSVASTASAPANQGTIDWTLDCGSNPVQDACIDCHSDAYNGEAGPQVITNWSGTPTGTHLKIVNTDSLPGNACADVTTWKNRCNGCHDKHSGTVQIPVPTAGADQAALGLKYDGVDHGGYVKLKPISGSTTEAQTCWNCHTAAENEWNSSPYSASTENWTTASFPSPASGIPARTVRSVHTGNVNVAGVSSVDEYLNNGDSGTVESVGVIRCTYCHDLHSLGANGFTPAAAPYLRGTWMSNPYSLDQPPMSGDTYSQNAFDNYQPDSPRLFSTTTDSKTKPGYFIDQNSDWPTVKTPASGTFYTYGETAGLCQLCHGTSTDGLDEYTTVSLWNGSNNGHANSALGGSGAASGNNIFDASRANDGADNGNYMGTQHGAEQRVTGSPANNYGVQGSQAPGTGNNDEPKSLGIFAAWNPSEPANGGNNGIPADNLGWFGGTAQDRNNLGDQYDTWYKGAGGGVGTAGTYNISGVYVGTSPRAHNFTCSKCHDPHASGLPALLTTNCLDVVRSTWTNGNAGPQTANAWGRQAAVNCHRKWSTTSENGWNTLSPNL